jgi:hypothetical protein
VGFTHILPLDSLSPQADNQSVVSKYVSFRRLTVVRHFILRALALTALILPLFAASPVLAQTSTPKKGTLIGTAWTGRETLPGFGSLTFEFEEGNNVTMIDARDTLPGTYKRNGAVITLSFDNGLVIYSGRINGKTMSGTARNPRTTWNWSVKLEEDLVPPDPDTKPEPEKKPAPDPVDAEKKAADLLEQAKKAAASGNASLARVRCRLILADYPYTKAAPEAKKLLEKLTK